MRVLVTGGAGFIGSTVCNLLVDSGHEVNILDNLSTGKKSNIPKNATFFKVDIGDTKKIKKILINKKIDVVFHFAAFVDNLESIKHPKKYYKNNFEKGKIFFETCIENNIKKFIYSSTAAVYGNKKKKVNEKDILKPISPYSRSKLKLEKFLNKKKNKIDCIILRYFNVAGVETKFRCGFDIQKGQNLILNLCVASTKNKTFIINGNNYKTSDGTTIRDYIHVEDLAQIHLLIAKVLFKNRTFKILNCGYGYGFSVKQILDQFSLVSKKKVKFKIGKRRPKDIIISIANNKRLTNFIRWKPKYNNLSHVVKSSLKWYKKCQASK